MIYNPAEHSSTHFDNYRYLVHDVHVVDVVSQVKHVESHDLHSPLSKYNPGSHAVQSVFVVPLQSLHVESH